jgi:hypothetical protein
MHSEEEFWLDSKENISEERNSIWKTSGAMKEFSFELLATYLRRSSTEKNEGGWERTCFKEYDFREFVIASVTFRLLYFRNPNMWITQVISIPSTVFATQRCHRILFFPASGFPEVLSSSLDLETDFSGWKFSWIFSTPSRQVAGLNRNWCRHHFLCHNSNLLFVNHYVIWRSIFWNSERFIQWAISKHIIIEQ